MLGETLQFSKVFEPIMQCIDGLFWVCYGYESSPLIDLGHEGGGIRTLTGLTYLEEQEGHSLEVLKPEAVSQYGRYILSDWITMVGVPKVSDRVLEFCDFMRRGAQERSKEYCYINEVAEVCFFNVDGHSWEFYSRREDHIRLLQDRYAADHSMEMRESLLADREQTLWNNWGL
jgi:hypothetical protein